MNPNYRYSRREVTKRKFVIGIQPPSTIKSTKVSPIAAYALTSPFKEPESRASSHTSSRELAESISSSPLAAIREHQNKHVTPSPRHEQTVQDETQFLSSTPKPGKTASRRRPTFYKDKPYSRPNSSCKSNKLNLSSIPKEPSIPAKNVAKTKTANTVQDRLETITSPSLAKRTNSMTKTTSYLGLNLSTRPKSSSKRPTENVKASSNQSSSSLDKAKSTSKPKSVTKTASNKESSSSVSASQNKRPSSSTKAASNQKQPAKSNQPINNRPSTILKSPSKPKKQVDSATRVERRKDDSILVQSQSSKRALPTMTRKKLLSSSRTDGSSNRSNSSWSMGRKRGSRVLQHRRLQQTSVSVEIGENEGEMEEDEENIVPSEVQMLLWQEQGTKRRKGDFSEVDVVLNVFTELLETQLDLCDSQAERRAVQILEKYLVKDITAMIDSCQTLKTLQTDTRKASKMLLQKQKTLMELQKKRLKIVADTLIYGTPKANRVDPDETAPTGAVSSGSTLFANTSNHVTMRLEERAIEEEKTTASSQNTQTVNKFLTDLKQMIDKC